MLMQAAPEFLQADARKDLLLRLAADSFERRCSKKEGKSACFRVGTETLRIKAADPAVFAAVTAALSHLQIKENSFPGLTLHVWEKDADAGGDWTAIGGFEKGQSVNLRLKAENGEFFAMTQPANRTSYVADLQNRNAYCEIASLREWPPWEAAAPFRPLIGAWLAQHGFCLIHAACVGWNGRALLLAGPGGSGKSTTAYTCAAHGWTYYADDLALLRMTGSVPEIFALYNTAKMNPDSIALFPGLKGLRPERAAPDEKVLLHLSNMQPAALGSGSVRPCAILFPTAAESAGRSEPRLLLLGQGEAFRLLAPNSLIFQPTGGSKAFAHLAALTRKLSCWRLELAPDPPQVETLLRDFLASR